MPGTMEKEIARLTGDPGARKAGLYLDQIQAQLDDCCKHKPIAAEALAALDKLGGEVEALRGELRQAHDRIATLEKHSGELMVLRERIALLEKKPTP